MTTGQFIFTSNSGTLWVFGNTNFPALSRPSQKVVKQNQRVGKMNEESPLDNLILAYPCPITWDSMSGDERERFCNKCSQKVFNISDLSRKDAESLLRDGVEDGKVCVKYYLRADGTIKTDNCPRILRPVRNKLKLIEKAVSAAIALLVSGMNLAGCTQISRAFSSHLYKPEEEEMTQYLGFPAPNEIRDVFFSVIPNAWAPNGKTATALQLELRSIVDKTKQVDVDLLEKLKNESWKSGKLELAFKSSILENLILAKAPMGLDVESKRIDMEKIRNELLNETLTKSKEFIVKGDDDSASKTIGSFIDVAKNGRSIIGKNETFLPEQEKWPLISNSEPTYFVATRDQVDSALQIMNDLIEKKVKYKYFSTDDLQAALKIKSLPLTQQEKEFARQRKEYKDEWQLGEMGLYSVVVAKYKGYDHNRVPTFKEQPVADFDTIEILNGKPLISNQYSAIVKDKKPIKVRYYLYESWSPDLRQNPDWKFNPNEMPEPGSMWILALQYFSNGIYSTGRGSVGRYEYTPENLEKIKKSIANGKKIWKK